MQLSVQWIVSALLLLSICISCKTNRKHFGWQSSNRWRFLRVYYILVSGVPNKKVIHQGAQLIPYPTHEKWKGRPRLYSESLRCARCCDRCFLPKPRSALRSGQSLSLRQWMFSCRSTLLGGSWATLQSLRRRCLPTFSASCIFVCIYSMRCPARFRLGSIFDKERAEDRERYHGNCNTCLDHLPKQLPHNIGGVFWGVDGGNADYCNDNHENRKAQGGA